jgi:hypothetical protein
MKDNNRKTSTNLLAAATVCAVALLIFVIVNKVKRPNAKQTPEALRQKNSNRIDIAITTKSLPAGTAISPNDIIVETVSLIKCPDFLYVHPANPTRIIGQVLAKPVVDGQALTLDCFAKGGTEPMGDMEAMTIFRMPITNKEIQNLDKIHVGCLVDVHINDNETNNTTILRGIHVIGISGDAVILNSDSKEKKKILSLLIKSQQEQMISTALKNNKVSLSLTESTYVSDIEKGPVVP